MINPNETHRTLATITKILNDDFGSIEALTTDGTKLEGFTPKTNLKVGDLVAVHVRFSIMADKHLIRNTVRKKYQPLKSA